MKPLRTGSLTSPVTPLATEPAAATWVAVPMECVGAGLAYQQLDLDINAKGLGYRPIPYTLFELIDLQRLIPRYDCVNVVMTTDQQKALASYVSLYYRQACENEDHDRAHLFNEFLDALLWGMEITFSL